MGDKETIIEAFCRRINEFVPVAIGNVYIDESTIFVEGRCYIDYCPIGGCRELVASVSGKRTRYVIYPDCVIGRL